MTSLDRDEYQHLISHALIQQDWHKAHDISLESLLYFKDDGELQYIQGSICAHLKQFDEAVHWLSKGIATGLDSLYPAAFQLGLIHLTSGNNEKAHDAWEVLNELAVNHYFYLFSQGMTQLVSNEFEKAQFNIEKGLSLNDDFPSINNDMEIALARINAILGQDQILDSHYQKNNLADN
ncbi:MAG: hypothetical protein RPR28_10010 [Cycloclasticus sp.]|jgi:hypothetical protein